MDTSKSFFGATNSEKNGLNTDFFHLNIAKKPLIDQQKAVKKVVNEPESPHKALFAKDPALIFAKPVKTAKESLSKEKSSVKAALPSKKPAFSNWKTSFSAYKSLFPGFQFKKTGLFFKNFFGKTLRFSAVSLSIFTVTFVALNLDAYQLRAKSFFNKLAQTQIEGQANLSAPTASSAKKTIAKTVSKEQPLPLKVIKDLEQLKHEVPPLNLTPVPLDYRIVIPKINLSAPVVQTDPFNLQKKDWKALENAILTDLEKGVVHYPGTGFPGQEGNIVITGHSSYYPWNKGKYKTVFAPLHDLAVNDQIVIWKDQKKYTYKITEKKVVKPNAVEVMQDSTGHRLTLVTCTPIGTTLKRLIIVAEQI